MTLISLTLLGCAPGALSPDLVAPDLLDRGYVVSRDSNELFVVDTETLGSVGSLDTTVFPGRINGNHMAMVGMDGAKVYVSAPEAGVVVVVEAASLTISGTIPVGRHATHASVSPDGAQLWIVNEDDNTISVIDTATDTVSRTLSDASLVVPHNVRFADTLAYVPSIGGNQITVFDRATYAVVDVIVAAGTELGACAGDPCGFADAQIDPDGVLFASHIETGTVLVYDTVASERLADVGVGLQPWSAFVDPFGDTPGMAMVPTWTDTAVARVDVAGERIMSGAGDQEVYGVNFSPLAPTEAFVLNRVRHEVAVIDRATGEATARIDVGGTTETGTTAMNGMILLPISSTGELLVLDPASGDIVARHAGVGSYPWSVATAAGQNYCH
ncbi:MAG: YncE family protein [Pseudomonadota bacterium]|nr:YncE family protein [Pseudomonadota bacterium]